MSITLAIDPGTTESQYLVWDGTRIIEHGHRENAALLSYLDGFKDLGCTHACLEMVASYGMAVGKEVFETVFWIGRYYERLTVLGFSTHRVYRQEVKLHLCHSARAKDANIRQALLDRFGGRSAIGLKKTPGPLYGISSHAWAALGLAITFQETKLNPATSTEPAPSGPPTASPSPA